MLEETLESPLDSKEIKLVNPKGNQSWISIERTNAEAEAPILGPPNSKSWFIAKKPWCWARLKAGGEGDNRGWDGWVASLTQRTWVWVNSGSWRWTGIPGVLQSMESQRVRHDWVSEQQQHICVSVNPQFPTYLPPSPFGNHKCVFYVCIIVFYLEDRQFPN